MRLSFDARDFLLGVSIVIAISLFILSSAKDTQISVLKKQVESIDSKYQEEVSGLSENSNVLYTSCISITQCKELYNFNIRTIFLEAAGFNGSKELRREAHLIKSGLPKFGEGLDFMKENCPEFPAGPLGTLYSLYYYTFDNDTIGIIMDDDAVNVHCAWIKKSGNYIQVFP